jgi:hypothetical protein
MNVDRAVLAFAGVIVLLSITLAWYFSLYWLVLTALSVGTVGGYVINTNVTAGAVAISAQTAVETKWVAVSSGATGELIKISSWSSTQG